ncbi:hypothetical protein [Candidatus Nitrosocosmicus hydrocola]|uniref:hypothetical protein n=1 Tax=Candidatus Nitrosocosmicus hydrocola TaxID=1826872 RepID=UPI0011E59E66|nr:hypothetical protein [Candidatus Nitrosocosmicus hydrocola]
MTSTKSFSTKNAGILIVAIFSIAISLGLSQVTSVVAQTDIVECSTEVDDESNETEMNNARSCADEDESEDEDNDASDSDNDSSGNQVATVSSSNNDEDDEESDASDSVATQPQNVVSSGPASADPEDNIIKPINLNKGFVSDKPLKTNNMNSNQDEDTETMKIIEDEFEFKQQLNKPTGVSELYETFDLPYTALYKNP